MDPPDANGTRELMDKLRMVLGSLEAEAYPTLASPKNVPKRASVALIIRINPDPQHWPAANEHDDDDGGSGGSDMGQLFGRGWARHGDAEILFIKRAARAGDRWKSHVALPGGRRDPEDDDDLAAAVRETMEEVGLDLTAPYAVHVGNLPQRLVSSDWGTTPLMVLCPYVFLLTSNTIPRLRLSTAEVASAHWVPLRALLAPSQRTHEYQDISNRLSRAAAGLRPWFFQFLLGRMTFGAIRLLPAESIYSSCDAAFLPPIGAGTKTALSPITDSPLALWGLTLGIMADFLELLPPHTALELWSWPSFTAWDARFVLWAMSYRFRSRKRLEIAEAAPSGGVVSYPATTEKEEEEEEEGVDSMDRPRDSVIRRIQILNGAGSINFMLEGYYAILRRAVGVVLVGRVAGIAAVGTLLYFKLRHRLRG